MQARAFCSRLNHVRVCCVSACVCVRMRVRCVCVRICVLRFVYLCVRLRVCWLCLLLNWNGCFLQSMVMLAKRCVPTDGLKTRSSLLAHAAGKLLCYLLRFFCRDCGVWRVVRALRSYEPVLCSSCVARACDKYVSLLLLMLVRFVSYGHDVWLRLIAVGV